MRVVHSTAHRRHDPRTEIQSGEATPPLEVPARADAIAAVLEADPAFELTLPTHHGLEPVAAVHDGNYVAWLERAWDEWAAAMPGLPQAIPDTFLNPALRAGMGPGPAPTGAVARLSYYGFDTTTVIVPGTYGAARGAADIALTATEIVLGGDRVAYALCRPPGHHAPRAAYGGYCFFNNVAVAVEHSRRRGAGPVAVLDLDLHHGNGTQQIFYDRPDVLYVSVHGDPNRTYPYFSGFADECGAGHGIGANLNVLLAEGCDDDAFLDAVDQALDAVEAFDPDLVFVSLGVDTYGPDPLSDLDVTADVFHPSGVAVASLDRPLVVVQEGGYHLDAMGGLVRRFLRGCDGLDEDGE
jgi:acetoin utilization deacetylase AcuC-like enzyme